jgi:dimeric dUTPase (all-alpha-NTP-PPase superfamily)
MQDRLDKVIALKHNLDLKSQANFQSRAVAYQVELCEMANELRFFKFWSENQEPTEHVLAEYVDCLHFLLSMANTLDARDMEFSYPNDGDNTAEMSMIEMFNFTMGFAVQLFSKPIMIGYAFMSFLDLGYKIGFTWEQIVEEYGKKHAENIQRQENGY